MLRNWRVGLYDFPNQPERSIAKAPSNIATGDLFSVVGGPILVAQLVGLVTTVVETQACTLKVLVDPTTGAGTTDVCANHANISADAAGTLYYVTGDFSDTLQEMDPASNGAVEAPTTYDLNGPWLCAPGTIELSASDTNTGVIRWSMLYKALDPNVRVYVA